MMDPTTSSTKLQQCPPPLALPSIEQPPTSGILSPDNLRLFKNLPSSLVIEPVGYGGGGKGGFQRGQSDPLKPKETKKKKKITKDNGSPSFPKQPPQPQQSLTPCPSSNLQCFSPTTPMSSTFVNKQQVFWPCQICEFVGKNRPAWRRHMAKDHREEAVATNEVFPCDQCYRVLTSLANVFAHVRYFHDELTCEVCGAKVVGAKGKEMHDFKFHGGVILVRNWKSKKEKEEEKMMVHFLRDEEKKEEETRLQKEMLSMLREEKKKKKKKARKERILAEKNMDKTMKKKKKVAKYKTVIDAMLESARSDAKKGKKMKTVDKKKKKKVVVHVPLNESIGEIWFPCAVENDDDNNNDNNNDKDAFSDDGGDNWSFDPFSVDLCKSFLRKLFEDTDMFDDEDEIEYVADVQGEKPGEGEEMSSSFDNDDCGIKKEEEVILQNIMFWAEGGDSVVAEEVVVGNNLDEAAAAAAADESSFSGQQKCERCGQNFFLDLDLHLHICDTSGPIFQQGNVVTLPIQDDVATWELLSQFGP